MNLKLMLENAARRYGGKKAIVSGDRRLSYAELDEASNKLANALIKMGVGKGDRVAILLPNIPEYPTLYFGIAKSGGIAVPLDVKYKINELTSLYDDAQPKVMITESPYLEPLISVLSRFKSIKHIIDMGAGFEGQYLSYREIMATSSAHRVEVELEPEDTALIAYTSGPTIRPRGVVLTHRSLVTEAAISADGFQQNDKDVAIMFALPMHHAIGLVGILLTAIYKGSAVVIVPGLSLSGVMGIIERERGTVFMGVPYIYALMISLAKTEGIKHDLSSLRLCGSAGAPLASSIIKQFKKHFGLDIIDFWGLTEAVCHITCPPVDGTGKTGSVGKALPGWEIKIVDDNNRELPVNHPGEIIAKGPLMKGYYNNPEATAEVMRDGWLYTGDIGKIDENGYLFILGRKKDLIIQKGQNIYPSDIEDVLHTHPKVAEVAAVGIPNKLRGEVVRAVIRLKEGEVATKKSIKQFCLERLANYKVPKQVIFTDSLPKTATGKICKEDLKGRLPTSSLLSPPPTLW